MKKILLTIATIASLYVGLMAQTSPDFGFENWNTLTGGVAEDPQGFASLNTLMLVGGSQSVFKETTNPFAGTASAKITTIKVQGAQIPNPYAPGTNLDTAGLLTIGTIDFISQSLVYGYQFVDRPTTLSFQSMYTPMAGDSAFVLAYLTRWNGTSRDTIAEGKYSTGTATTSYVANSITMTYNPSFATVVPDTQQVFISSSVYSHNGAKIGSAFYIDALEWSGWNSINEIEKNQVFVNAYPNPAFGTINFTSDKSISTINVMDITGRLIDSYPVQNNKLSVETNAFNAGVYFFNALENNKIVSRGKFQVAR